MPRVYFVTPEILSKFKEPFGVLIRGSFAETMRRFDELMCREQPCMIVSVGDTVSRNLHRRRIATQLSITDNKSMRRRIRPQVYPAKNLVRVKNPQGTITEEAIAAVRDALQGDVQTHLFVEGEEDLLTLIAVVYAPENAWVVYGQPREGIVVVKVTSAKKADAERILDSMKTVHAK